MSHRVSMLPVKGGCVREETEGASLDSGCNEVASELWTERVFPEKEAGAVSVSRSVKPK